MKKLITCFMLALVFPLLVFADTRPNKPFRPTASGSGMDIRPHSKKALAEHAEKFHTGHWKWRVYQVPSGPDESDAYQITEGPNSWTNLEGRGNISPEHMKHYDTMVTPHVEKTSPIPT